MSNILSFPVNRKLTLLDLRIRHLLKIHETGENEELKEKLLTMSATLFIMSGLDSSDFHQSHKKLAQLEHELIQLEQTYGFINSA